MFDVENLKDLQVFVFETPYDYFHDNMFARQVLCDSWGMKLKGYRKYFPYGVLPIDHLDFIATQIVCCRRKPGTELYHPIMGVKSLTLAQCHKFKIEFPIYKHLFCGEVETYSEHIESIESWVEHNQPENIAYSMGFTIDPDETKEMKKLLIEFGWALFYLHYKEANVQNVIHGVSKTFKLDEDSKRIGFEYLSGKQGRLDSVLTKSYNNVESEIMTLDTAQFTNRFILEAKRFELLWLKRMVFNEESSYLKESKKSA